MTTTAVALTDLGLLRQRNEDSFLLDQDASLYVVADGMGGHAAGDVASQTAVAAFAAAFAAGGNLLAALRAANRSVIERGQAEPGLAGMGTTLTALHLAGGRARVAHVGDSRLYRLRGGVLEQLTRDHTVAEEMIERGQLTRAGAMQHPANSVLTRALGSRSEVEIDELAEFVAPGDVLLLCSDGLTSMVADEEVRTILLSNDSLTERAAALVAAANQRGGLDNITVVLIAV